MLDKSAKLNSVAGTKTVKNSYSTIIFPTCHGCIIEKYGYSPALTNVWENVSYGIIKLLLNSPSGFPDGVPDITL